jgi:hypothetical protein
LWRLCEQRRRIFGPARRALKDRLFILNVIIRIINDITPEKMTIAARVHFTQRIIINQRFFVLQTHILLIPSAKNQKGVDKWNIVF